MQYQTDKYKKLGEGTFVSIDTEGLKKYKSQKTQMNKLSKVDEITSDINSLRNELSEIKEALKILIDSKK